MKRAQGDIWPGWKLFSQRDAHGKQKCLVVNTSGRPCGQELTYHSTTANFKKHLAAVHPSISKELDEEIESLEKKARTLPSAQPPDQSRLSDFFDPLKVNERVKANAVLIKALEKDAVRFVCQDLRPFSAVEGAPRALPPLSHLSAPLFLILVLTSLFRRRLQAGHAERPRKAAAETIRP